MCSSLYLRDQTIGAVFELANHCLQLFIRSARRTVIRAIISMRYQLLIAYHEYNIIIVCDDLTAPAIHFILVGRGLAADIDLL